MQDFPALEIEKQGIDYEKIRRQAVAYANKNGYREDAEDFAQACLLYAFEKNTDVIYLKRRFIDYLRSNYGDTRRPGGDAKSRARRTAVELDEEVAGFEPQARHVGVRVGDYLDHLPKYERLIYVLHKKYDVPLKQIAEIQGVPESRIFQVMKGIQQTVVDQQAIVDSLHIDNLPADNLLQVDWITF